MKKKSFIDQACEKVGVSRSTYHRASRRLKQGEELSVHETEVLTAYHTIVARAKAKLVLINSEQNAETIDVD